MNFQYFSAYFVFIKKQNGIVDEELISLKDKTNEIQRRYGGNNGGGLGGGGGGGSEAAAAYPNEKRPIGFDDQEVSKKEPI